MKQPYGRMSTERGPPMGWSGSCRGGVGHARWAVVDHARVGWVIQGWVMQECSGSYRGRVRGNIGVGWVM